MDAEPQMGLGETGAVGAATSGVAAAALAGASAACCTGPVLAPMVVAVLGASGAAWAAGLKPYTPYLFSVAGAFLALGFWVTYRRRPSCVVGGSARAGRLHRGAQRLARGMLWGSLLVWLGSIALAVYATYFDNPFL